MDSSSTHSRISKLPKPVLAALCLQKLDGAGELKIERMKKPELLERLMEWVS